MSPINCSAIIQYNTDHGGTSMHGGIIELINNTSMLHALTKIHPVVYVIGNKMHVYI
jgi:hypothetical protein